MRCRKGKTKCVYENGRAPCKNCAKGMHECYLPSESMSHGGHGVSPARVQQRARESLPSERTIAGATNERPGPPASSVSRHVSATNEKYVHTSLFVLFLLLSLSLPVDFSLSDTSPPFLSYPDFPPFPVGALALRSICAFSLASRSLVAPFFFRPATNFPKPPPPPPPNPRFSACN